MAADEVRNGVFVYRNTLFAEVSEGKRHARASASELKDLLLPKKNAPPSKDQVAHWYEAQLLHYGLPRVKDKNAAKVRLLGAISSGSLVVPNHVQQLESDLKKRYASVQRKAKVGARKASSPGTVSAGKKRKVSELESEATTSARTKMSIHVDGMTIDIDRRPATAVETPTKRQRESTAKEETTKSPSLAKASRRTPVTKKTTTSSGSSTATSTQIGARPKQTARRTGQFTTLPRAHSSQCQTTTRTPIPIVDDEPPPPYSEYEDAFTSSTLASPSPHKRGKVVQLSGSYSISTDRYYSRSQLSVRLSHPRDQLWGRFTIGSNTGIIWLYSINQFGINLLVQKSFGWRSEDDDTGTL